MQLNTVGIRVSSWKELKEKVVASVHAFIYTAGTDQREGGGGEGRKERERRGKKESENSLVDGGGGAICRGLNFRD